VAYQIENSGSEILVTDSETEKTALAAIEILKQNGTVRKLPQIFVCGSSSSGRTDLRSILQDKSAPFASAAEVGDEESKSK